MVVVHQARVERENVSGAAEAVAVADEVTHRDAFGADPEAEGEAADLGDGLGDACAEEILVRDRHDALAGLRPEGGDAVGVHGIEEVGSLNVEVGEAP